MKTTIRYVLLWGPLALSAKNWVIDIKQLDTSSFPYQPSTATFSNPNPKSNSHKTHQHHSSSSSSTIILIQKYKIKIFREFNRGDIIYLKLKYKLRMN